MLQFPLVFRLALWLLCTKLNISAQKRGKLQLYIVNDTDYPISVVWLNNPRIEGKDLIPLSTGPIQARTIETYRANPNDALVLHQENENCETQKGMHNKPKGNCPSVYVTVAHQDGQTDDPTSIIILHPNFKATSQPVTSPRLLSKAMNQGMNLDASIQIVNKSGKNVSLFWLNPEDRSLAPMSADPLETRTESHLFSASVFHQFILQENCQMEKQCAMQIDHNEECGTREECQVRYFRVTAKEMEVTILPEFKDIEIKPFPYDPLASFEYARGVDLYQQCHDHVRPELWFESPEPIQSAIETCIKNHWHRTEYPAERLQSYIDYKMEHYLCDDPRLATTPPVGIEFWTSRADHRRRTVFVLRTSESSQIHLVSDFISSEECQALLDPVEDQWQQTKVSDGKGGTRPNPVRKAQIARIDVPWNEEDSLVTQVGRKVFEYTNHVHPSLGITEEGQEPMMAIRYQGRGRDDPTPDQYKSHCDSDCGGRPIRQGQRVATMVMFCEMPTDGGHTNFRSAHVHVKANPGNALFFSYVNPHTREQDNGKSLHAGCPVYEGTKKIVTQWIRVGVDHENPYTDFPM